MIKKVALVGIGEIARAQHIPAIAASTHWELAATVSRASELDGIENFISVEALLAARPDVTTVSLCMPPAPRFDIAKTAIAGGCHVMLEKPPGATLRECHALHALAQKAGVSLFATWHSREASMLDICETWLADKAITGFNITWKEDVHQWHPGQEWLWEAGGMGVFDAGINALSILSKIVPEPVRVTKAELEVPGNRQTPIAAQVELQTLSGAPGSAVFDWRQKGDPVWQMSIETRQGCVEISDGGAAAMINGELQNSTEEAPTLTQEYPRLYQRMHQLIDENATDCDFTPLALVADIFMLADRQSVENFHY